MAEPTGRRFRPDRRQSGLHIGGAGTSVVVAKSLITGNGAKFAPSTFGI
jgi:hypothetical protein